MKLSTNSAFSFLDIKVKVAESFLKKEKSHYSYLSFQQQQQQQKKKKIKREKYEKESLMCINITVMLRD